MGEMRNRREIAAEATQRVIVEAATRLLLENGYTGTSMGDIAREAGVAVQTIYNSIGSKRDLLSRVLDFAAAGDEAPTPVPVFMHERAKQATDAREIIGQLVAFWRGGLARSAPVFGVIRQAAALDPEVAELERQRAAQRLRNYGQAAGSFAERGALRPGLSLDEAATTIFAVGHPDIYRFLVLDQGWPPERWARWVEATLTAALLREE
jgi:AcrR family transcriptional regulator